MRVLCKFRFGVRLHIFFNIPCTSFHYKFRLRLFSTYRGGFATFKPADTEFFTRAEAALAAQGPLQHFTVHRLLADNVGGVVS